MGRAVQGEASYHGRGRDRGRGLEGPAGGPAETISTEKSGGISPVNDSSKLSKIEPLVIRRTFTWPGRHGPWRIAIAIVQPSAFVNATFPGATTTWHSLWASSIGRRT